MSYLVVFLGAGIGGAARHGMNMWVARLMGTHFPWHTLVINILSGATPVVSTHLCNRPRREGHLSYGWR